MEGWELPQGAQTQGVPTQEDRRTGLRDHIAFSYNSVRGGARLPPASRDGFHSLTLPQPFIRLVAENGRPPHGFI